MRADISPSELERLLWHMPNVARHATSEFARGFAQSVLKQSQRRAWRPSAKQLPIMRELVSDLFRNGGNEEGDGQVIE